MPAKVFCFIKDAGFRSTTLLKLNFFTGIFQRFWSCHQLDTLQNSYFEKYILLQKIFFNGWFCSFLKFQWLMHTFFSYWNFCMQLLNLAKWTVNKKNKDMWFNLFLQRWNIAKLPVGNSENNGLKNIKFTFKNFWMQVFHIYNLKSKWQN